MSDKHMVMLTDDELLCLDGKTDREEVVSKIKVVKLRREVKEGGVSAWFSKVIVAAIERGKLDVHGRSGGYSCEKCGESATVYPKYQRGPKKGQTNHNKKPWGARRMVVAGLHFCVGCFTDTLKGEISALAEKGDARFEIVFSGFTSSVVKENKRICPKCNEPCWDFDMGLSRTLMGDGHYYGKCPHCGFESLPFGNTFNHTGHWRLAPVSELKAVKSGRFTLYQREKLED